MYAECGSGSGLPQGGSEPIYNVEHIVHFGAIIVRDKLLTRHGLMEWNTGGSCGPVYAAPRDFCEWVGLFHSAGIRVVPVQRHDDFCAALVQHEAAQWLCVVNLCPRPQFQCQALCRQYCEWLMRDCAILGRGCPECYPVPLAEMRRRIASAVAAELC